MRLYYDFDPIVDSHTNPEIRVKWRQRTQASFLYIISPEIWEARLLEFQFFSKLLEILFLKRCIWGKFQCKVWRLSFLEWKGSQIFRFDIFLPNSILAGVWEVIAKLRQYIVTVYI